MKYTILLALVASVSSIRIEGLPAAAPAAAAAAPLTWNYKSTGGHAGVNRLPNAPKTPTVAPFRLGGDGPAGKSTGHLSTPRGMA